MIAVIINVAILAALVGWALWAAFSHNFQGKHTPIPVEVDRKRVTAYGGLDVDEVTSALRNGR